MASAPVDRVSLSCYGNIVNTGFVAIKGPKVRGYAQVVMCFRLDAAPTTEAPQDPPAG